MRSRFRVNRRAGVIGWSWVAGLACLAALVHAAPNASAAAASHPLLMTFWSDDFAHHAGNPLPGSVDASGAIVVNPTLTQQLASVDVLAYAFLRVDEAGDVYFAHPDVDLSSADRVEFCKQHASACPHAESASGGSFSAFAHLDNQAHDLRRIVSIGGAGSQASMDNALSHIDEFVASATALIRAYRLDGIDLDFEPDELFTVGQGESYVRLVNGLRHALGPLAFISIEVPGDWESIRSIDCPAGAPCLRNLTAIAAAAYVSVMGYDFHHPEYPGGVTANDSSLYPDADEPLLPRFYHASDSQSVQYLTSRGVPAEKVLLGFPAYFVFYSAVHGTVANGGLYQPYDHTVTQMFDLGYKDIGSDRIAAELLKSGFIRYAHMVGGELSAVYAFNAKSNQWISFEDPESVAAKAKFVRARNLGGMMMWEIGEDLPIHSGHSLLRSARRALSRVAH